MTSEIAVTEGERMGSAESAGMREPGMTEATATKAHMAAESAAVSTATAAVSTTAAMGQRRDRRTGYEDRRGGQRYHRLAHRDLFLCLLRQAPTLKLALRNWYRCNVRPPAIVAASRTNDGHSNQNTQMTNKIFSDTEVSFWIFDFMTG